MVVQRKFPDKKKVLEEFLKELPFELSYTPKNIDNSLFEIRDKKDYPILYSAIVEEVDNFITGDQDFSSVDINKPEILIPREFLDKYC
jgi:predicted nucleic acid-binding protein